MHVIFYIIFICLQTKQGNCIKRNDSVECKRICGQRGGGQPEMAQWSRVDHAHLEKLGSQHPHEAGNIRTLISAFMNTMYLDYAHPRLLEDILRLSSDLHVSSSSPSSSLFLI